MFGAALSWDVLAAAGAGAAVSLLLAIVHLRVLVPRLPEPDPDEVGAEVIAAKPRYRDLVTPARTAVLSVLAMAAGAATSQVPAWGRGIWWVWAGSVLTLVAVDQATTFLPVRLWRWCLAEGLIAAAVTAALVSTRPADLLACLVLGAVTAGLFWLVWRLGAGLGFGDVRLAAGTGAVGAVLGLEGWAASLMATALTGVLIGVGTTLVRRFRPSPWGTVFGYGPALWLGPWGALAVSGAPWQ
ncbi:Uncharacterised protein [Acidipropionibacterium jensenii]|uniref:Prepilin type IV endopeptidase peptidase domain-containing protein n=3 Tax=Acidipropionibacterium jensenii TaxID=1749 RepID=A0A448NX65_9ACTN|nr:prepilin peptidase [Acidipropionibacterium jensenii]MDN5976923.1 prepilin peptidase [Acidipropionibacterium jensenii]MDN6427895.1 prepilin peptidase [Acidipropionibacterium jensenii]MDN6514095.1 prepilin peptidase [Acidipropionibacterium jensenii]MDN6812330.1 prepilin peptidase [Acidipropionibacterium jensenii]QCV87024.1 leader peptidase (prepilin peptidase)/N-methyltransferase [Acidipropionibacterium jensenii]